ncbi:MAG TPA: hypothetical protein EYG68_00270 [Leucothrix mucor]|nr:hypothetical protein [Leucothrix mucor]
MDFINTSLNFIQNPENSWVLYSIAAFLILDGFILKLAYKFLPSLTEKLKEDKPVISKSASSFLNFSAHLNTIAGIALAIATFYFTQMQ